MAPITTRLSESPLVLALCGLILVSALLLRIFPDLETVFFLMPGHTTTRPWQVVTSGYFEDAGINLIVGVGMLVAVSLLLVPAWGELEFVRYIVLVNAIQGCLSWIHMIILYILFRSEHFLFARLGGLTGILASLAVAIKQQAHTTGAERALLLPITTAGAAGGGAGGLSPSADRLLSGPLAAYAPLLCVGWAMLLLCTTHSGPPDELLFALNGTFCAWFYLRYLQPKRGAISAGDPSEAFGLATLLPPPVRAPLRLLGDACFAATSSCGIFPPPGWGVAGDALGVDAPGGAGAGVGGGIELSPTLELLRTPAPPSANVTTTDPEVAERRRERARALIEARLASKASAGGGEGRPSDAASAVTPATPATPDVHMATPTAASAVSHE